MNVVGEESIGYLRETTGSMTCNFVLNCFKLYNYLDVGRLSNGARTAQRANGICYYLVYVAYVH